MNMNCQIVEMLSSTLFFLTRGTHSLILTLFMNRTLFVEFEKEGKASMSFDLFLCPMRRDIYTSES